LFLNWYRKKCLMMVNVFLLLWLCILIVCLCMTTLTEVFPCFFLSYKAHARVKPAKTGHGSTLPVVFYVFLCSVYVYCLFCDVHCIVCVYMFTEQLPPGGYSIVVKYIISYQTCSAAWYDIKLLYWTVYFRLWQYRSVNPYPANVENMVSS
jgi:hypothetical protein